MNEIRQQALDLFTRIHEGQFRRDGITPYITHPIAVAEIALKYIETNFVGSFDEEAKDRLYIIALGHDSVEDHPDKITFEDIQKLFGFEVRRAIQNLTKLPNETYLESILRARPYSYSRIVKIADNTHNLSTLNPKKDKHKIDKYIMSKYILEH